MIVSLKPDVLRWARTRAGLEQGELADVLKVSPSVISKWETSGRLRYSEAEKLANKTNTPFGLLFLTEPLDEKLPIKDFRTVEGAPIRKPSTELLDTIRVMQERQAWMREYLAGHDEPPLSFVGSRNLRHNRLKVAAEIRSALGMDVGWASKLKSWSEALVEFRRSVEQIGVLIFINGVVGNNTHRPLQVSEFRGFALSDPYAPLIFINNADAKSAQMFTLAHELAHIWIGEGGVSNLDRLQAPGLEVEVFCNQVAAEVLVPEAEMKVVWKNVRASEEPFDALAAHFRVSPIVAARRAQDLGFITQREFLSFYAHKQKADFIARKSDGGNFWRTNSVRVDPRFGTAVVNAAREGRILYSEAFSLTGLKGKSFETYARSLGY